MSSEMMYVGQELDIFSEATTWKRYWAGVISPFLGREVLEVGAGFGVNTPLLLSSQQSRWVCLEPDTELVTRLRANCQALPESARVEVRQGVLTDLPESESFDSIIYIDVLEHIEHDASEVELAARYLKPGGRLIVLSPAHQFLFSEFDRSIGHFRRYSRDTLLALQPDSLELERQVYLDSAGMLLSLANRALLRQSLPTRRQIRFWNNWVLPISAVTDPLLGFRVGKTIVVIWKRHGT